MASQSGAFSGELRSQPMRFVEAVTYFAEHVLPGKQAADSVEAHGGADLERGVRFGDAAPDDEAAGQRAQLRFGLRPRLVGVGRDGVREAGAAFAEPI